MKAFFTVFAASLTFALTATATEVPRFETYFGFDWVRFNPNTPDIPSFNADGGSFQFVYNAAHGLGIAFDAGAVTKDTFSGVFSNRQEHFLLGPRWGLNKHSRLRPFVEVLFGVSNGSESVDVNNINLVPTVNPLSTQITIPSNISVRLTATRTSFAMMAGGGLDIKITKHIAYRLFDADYYLCRPVSLITGENVNKNNLRLTTGVNFTWGAE